ncbi:hypothetical protein F4805DRAFT_78473 [Annulohypoxylon moriforme]|nr:hypothetical protein F4805DRAFT_78473 [Annulohypoxylon moriforme]
MYLSPSSVIRSENLDDLLSHWAAFPCSSCSFFFSYIQLYNLTTFNAFSTYTYYTTTLSPIRTVILLLYIGFLTDHTYKVACTTFTFGTRLALPHLHFLLSAFLLFRHIYMS